MDNLHNSQEIRELKKNWGTGYNRRKWEVVGGIVELDSIQFTFI